LDLGNGVKTNTKMPYPAIGNGTFPGILLSPGSGIADKNETIGFVHNYGTKSPTPLWQISQYLSERGSKVLWYDKRGVGANQIILDTDVWRNGTVNDLIQDSKKALNVLTQQPKVDSKRIIIIGHSKGILYDPRVVIDNSTKVKNIILIGTLAQNPVKVLYYYQVVSFPLQYAGQILDKNYTGLISINQIVTDPLLKNFLVPFSVLQSNNIKDVTAALIKHFGTMGYISIDKQLVSLLIKNMKILQIPIL
jgi:hypothetical protein